MEGDQVIGRSGYRVVEKFLHSEYREESSQIVWHLS
jgi:hypothetical protein